MADAALQHLIAADTLPPDHPHTLRVRRIAADLIAAAYDEKTFARHPMLRARIRRRLQSSEEEINWNVDVSVDWSTIDACCEHDGEIRISIASLYVFWKDADVAATLGHEIGHVIAGHPTEELRKRAWVRALVHFTEELLDVPAGGDKIDTWETLYMRPHYMGTELEADRIGLLLLGAAGYHPLVAPNSWFSCASIFPSTGAEYDDLNARHPPDMIRGQKLLHTKVMDEALELYAQALRSGKFSGPLDSVASFLKLQLDCCKFWIDGRLQRVWANLLNYFARDSISRGTSKLLPWECPAPPPLKVMEHCLVVQSHHNKECLLCNRDPESAAHVAFNCCFAKQVWRSILSWVGMPIILPPAIPSVDVWWQHLRSLLPEKKRKALDTLFVLIVWQLWSERNARLLGEEEKMTSAQLTAKIEQQALEWIGAGAKDLGGCLRLSPTQDIYFI